MNSSRSTINHRSMHPGFMFMLGLLLSLIATVLPGLSYSASGTTSCPTGAGFSGGTGTTTDVYLIANTTDLMLLSTSSDVWSCSFKLTADIDMSGITNFTRIGTSNTAMFYGNFDGANFTISNLTISWNVNPGVGVFGFTAEGSSIKNIKLNNLVVSGTGSVGGLVGSNKGSISNVELISADVRGTGNLVGGIAGYGEGKIESISADTVTISGNNDVGGIVGYHAEAGSIEVVTLDSVSVTGKDNVGGVAGQGWRNVISVNANIVHVSGEDNVGGIAGYNNRVIQSVTADTITVHGKSYIGGITGESNGNISLVTATSIKVSSDVSITGDVHAGGIAGSSGKIIEKIVLTTSDVISSGSRIGGVVGQYFAANLTNVELRGVKVSGLNSVGGIAGIRQDLGHIEEVIFRSGEITGDTAVGGIAGSNEASTSVLYSIARAAILDSRVTGISSTGGIAGENYSLISESAVINTSADVSAMQITDFNSTSDVGGVVGTSFNGGKIENSYVSIGVTVSVADRGAGGLIGIWNPTTTIKNSYSAADLLDRSTSSTFRQLVGIFGAGCNSTSCDVDLKSYYLTGDVVMPGQESLTVAQFTTSDTFISAGWDIIQLTEENQTECSVWSMGVLTGQTTPVNDGYPFLSWIYRDSDDCPWDPDAGSGSSGSGSSGSGGSGSSGSGSGSSESSGSGSGSSGSSGSGSSGSGSSGSGSSGSGSGSSESSDEGSVPRGPAAPPVVIPPKQSPTTPVTQTGNGEAVVVAPGQATSLVDGVVNSVIIQIVQNQIKQLAVRNVEVEIKSVDQANQIKPVTPNLVMQFEQAGNANILGNGFRPNSTVYVWLLSTPTKLGEVEVKPDGRFDAAMLIPADFPLGEHKLQVNGVSTNNEVISASMGVVVVAKPAPVTPTPTPTIVKKRALNLSFFPTQTAPERSQATKIRNLVASLKPGDVVTCKSFSTNKSTSQRNQAARIATKLCAPLKSSPATLRFNGTAPKNASTLLAAKLKPIRVQVFLRTTSN